MTKTQHPWQTGPTELIEFALERMHKGSDFDRRLAFLILDVGVETLFKTFLTLPESVMQFQIKRGDRLEASQGNFHELLRGIQGSNPKKSSGFNFAHLEHYRNLRNTLYHLGNQVMAVPMEQLAGYAALAVDLLREYLDVDLTKLLVPPEPEIQTGDDPVMDSVEVEISSGRYRLERLKNQSIRILSLDTNTFETPVKPFAKQGKRARGCRVFGPGQLRESYNLSPCVPLPWREGGWGVRSERRHAYRENHHRSGGHE